MSQLNDPIELMDGPLTVIQPINGQPIAFMAGLGHIRLQWLPSPHLEFDLSYTSLEPVMLNEGLPIHVRTYRATTIDTIEADPVVYTGELEGEVVRDIQWSWKPEPVQDLASVLFHLPNFRFYDGTSIQSQNRGGGEEGSSRPGRLEIEAMGWHITLDSIEGHADLEDELRKRGGYALTHVGQLRRSGGEAFGEEEVGLLFQALQGFFSFACGRKVSALLPLGFDAQGEEIWRKWERPRVAPYQGAEAWFSTKHPRSLGEMLPGFLSAWDDPTWGETVRMALYWHSQSNTDLGAEGAIILVQACLEMLGWVWLVQAKDTSRYTENQFKKMPADEALRQLLNACGIPTELPAELSHLGAAAPTEGWIDGPKAWSEMRNSIVHPDHKKRHLLHSAPAVMEETWHLGMWYIEMVLLRLFNYNGLYSNRLNRDLRMERAESVPWATLLPSI